MDLATVKRYVHNIAYFLMIFTIAVFIVPAIKTALLLIFPAAKDSSAVSGMASVVKLVDDLCVIYKIVCFPKYGEYILIGVTVIWSLFDLIWRTARGHKIRWRFVLLLVISVILPAFVILSRIFLL